MKDAFGYFVTMVVVLAIAGTIAANSVARAVEANASAQVEIARIQEPTRQLQISLDAVERASKKDRVVDALAGILACLIGLGALYVLKRNESPDSHRRHEAYERFTIERERGVR